MRFLKEYKEAEADMKLNGGIEEVIYPNPIDILAGKLSYAVYDFLTQRTEEAIITRDFRDYDSMVLKYWGILDRLELVGMEMNSMIEKRETRKLIEEMINGEHEELIEELDSFIRPFYRNDFSD